MLIAIGVLVLVVIVMANKSDPAQQRDNGSSLPNPSPIPATGTTGVPSPASSILMDGHAYKGSDVMATNAGQLAAQTNMTLTQQPWVGRPPLPSRNVVSSTPESTPLLAKELITGAKTLKPLAQTTSLSTMGLRKL